MLNWRQEQALRLVLLDPGDVLGETSGAGWEPISTRDDGGTEASFADGIEKLLNQYLDGLGDRFPSDGVEQLLNGSGADGNEEDSPSSQTGLLDELKKVLAGWLETADERIRAALGVALGAAAVAGCIAAFAAWNEKLRLDSIPPAETLARLRNWATDQAARILATLNATILQDLLELILTGLREGLSIADVIAKIKAYLKKQMARAKQTALNNVREALNKGEYEASTSLGARMKRWRTVGDDRVCSLCQENERQGTIPIGEAFRSGHQYPLAHDACRCTVEYFGVTRGSALQAGQWIRLPRPRGSHARAFCG